MVLAQALPKTTFDEFVGLVCSVLIKTKANVVSMIFFNAADLLVGFPVLTR